MGTGNGNVLEEGEGVGRREVGNEVSEEENREGQHTEFGRSTVVRTEDYGVEWKEVKEIPLWRILCGKRRREVGQAHWRGRLSDGEECSRRAGGGRLRRRAKFGGATSKLTSK